MPIHIRGERPVGDANDLPSGEIDASWLSMYGTPSLLTVVGGVLTVDGSGTYRISPESGTADDVTAIAGADRVGDTVIFMNQTIGHTITYKHQGNLHLSGTDFEARTIYSVIILRCVLLSPMTWIHVSSSHNE